MFLKLFVGVRSIFRSIRVSHTFFLNFDIFFFEFFFFFAGILDTLGLVVGLTMGSVIGLVISAVQGGG